MTMFVGEPDFRHGTAQRAGVLLVNLGTPDAPSRGALRRYLREFLWDPRVVEFPRPLWWLILNLIILNLRPARSAKAYQKIWTETGSPLLTISQRQSDALDTELQGRLPRREVQVALGMRYGNPSIAAGLNALRRSGVRRLLVLPLYPQYSATTTASVFDAVADVLKTWRWLPELRMIAHYADNAAYIQAIATRIAQAWEQQGRGDIVLFSFHGIPQRYLLKGDPYHCQCQKTACLIAAALGLGVDQWQCCFQSRFGREQWLQPYTEQVLQELAAKGVGSIDVFCPGFAADCLETLEEIAIANRALYLQAGGKQFNYIPALNDMPEHIEALSDLVIHHLQGWPEASPDFDAEQRAHEQAQSRDRALAMGAKQ